MPGPGEAPAFIGLGGNIGDPVAAMAEALRSINAGEDSRVLAVSSLYRTPPWGKTDQPDFVNAVANVATTRSPGAFLALCLAVESRLKRVRRERWGPRLIDIDILIFGEVVVDEPGLTLPHPRLTQRAFVLVPLAEIAPDLVVEGATVSCWSSSVARDGIERISVDGNWWKS